MIGGRAAHAGKWAKVAKMTRLTVRQVRRREFDFGRYVRRCLPPREIRRLSRAYRKRYRASLRQWLIEHDRLMFECCTWMGVEVWKNPLDAWIYQEILHEVRPDVVVELGSARGGAALYLSHLQQLLGDGIVVSVDVDRSSFEVEHPRLVTVTGPSSHPSTLEQVTALCRDRRVLVIHDADHRKEQVLEDLAVYAPLVTVGSYLVVEDGLVDLFRPWEALGVSYQGPLVAIEEFLRGTDEFEVDEGRERYVLTANPRGFLRRVR